MTNIYGIRPGAIIRFVGRSGRTTLTVVRVSGRSCWYDDGTGEIVRAAWATINGYIRDYSPEIEPHDLAVRVYCAGDEQQ